MKLPAFATSKVFWTIAVLIVLGIGYTITRPEPQPVYTTAEVVRQDLLQTVSATGSVRGATELDLSYEISGEISDLMYAKGDTVIAGAVLGQLNASQIQDSVLEAQATVAAAQAELQKLLAGASPEEINIKEQRVAAATVSLNLRKQELSDLEAQLVVDEKTKKDTLADATRDLETIQNNALRIMETELFDITTALDSVEDIVDDTNKDDTLGVQSLVFTQNTLNLIPGVESAFVTARNAVTTAKNTKTTSDISAALSAVYEVLVDMSTVLDRMNTVLKNTPAASTYSQTAIDADQVTMQSHHATISASMTAVQTAESNWQAKKTAYTTAENAWQNFLTTKNTKLNQAIGAVSSAEVEKSLAEAELTLTTTTARSEDIALQRARVAQAVAGLERVQNDLTKTKLIAPLNGTITDIIYEIGEKVSPGQPAIKMISESGLEIEVDIPESDIAKVAVDEAVHITLDAFGDDVVYSGHVMFVDPAETVIQDVVYYRVSVVFDDRELVGVKPGMTANIDIITATRDNVLQVPARAVKTDDEDKKYVDILEADMSVTKKIVTTGLRGDGGMIEVISGLEEGENVITFVEEVD